MLHLPTEVESDHFLVPTEQEKPSDVIIGLRADYFSVEVKKSLLLATALTSSRCGRRWRIGAAEGPTRVNLRGPVRMCALYSCTRVLFGLDRVCSPFWPVRRYSRASACAHASLTRSGTPTGVVGRDMVRGSDAEHRKGLRWLGLLALRTSLPTSKTTTPPDFAGAQVHTTTNLEGGSKRDPGGFRV